MPLLVLTADRPLDVQHAAAAQTIDQVKLYGDHVRSFFDLGLPDAAPSALAGLRRAAAQAVCQTLGPLPGPVHLNLRARKPLEPATAKNEAEHALSARITELIEKPFARHAPETFLADAAVRAAARALAGAASGAIVVGPLPAFGRNLAEPVAELAKLLGFPIFAEAASQLRFALAGDALSAPFFDWLLSIPDAAERHRPEVLLCVGQTPTSSAFERWAAHAPKRLVLAAHGLPDALGSAELVASGDLSRGLAALIAELKGLGASPKAAAFPDGVRKAHQICESRVTAALNEPANELTEAAAVKSVVESLPDGVVLALGNSLPIRDVDAYVTRAARVIVAAQRGANGIDGLISGAIGSAIGSGAPSLLLLGDVSFLHDLGGLSAARLVSTPLVIAVIDNAGGRIFDQLPVQKLYGSTPDAAKLWLTPPELDLAHAAALFGLSYEAPPTPDAIRSATARALTRRQPTLLHLRVGPDSDAAMRQRILASLATELSEIKA